MPETVLVTGISGNLGIRLLPQAALSAFRIVGVDLHPPATMVGTGLPAGPGPGPTGLPEGFVFEQLDLSDPGSAPRWQQLLGDYSVSRVAHLAFVIDPVRTGITAEVRMREANVGGTRRLLEAIAALNRDRAAPRVRVLVYPSSVSAYGSDLPGPVREDFPLGAHTLPYALHKQECDLLVQERFADLGGCGVVVLRPPVFAGRSMDNYILRALRGLPSGRGRLARLLESLGIRLPLLAPADRRALQHRFQFIHVDDVARLIAHFLAEFSPGRLEIFNVAGRGEPLELAECMRLAGTTVARVPGYRVLRALISLMGRLGISGVPAQSLPYFFGTYLMDTSRLRTRLGDRYPALVRYTCRDAFADSFTSSDE